MSAVKGLFLIAPSMRLFGSQEALGSIGYYTYLLNKDFINTIEREKNPAKYHAFSKKALGNLMNLHAKIRQYQEENTIKAPTFFALTHDDPVVPSKNLLVQASRYFTNKRNKALVFIKPGLEGAYKRSSIETNFLNSYFPEKRIENFSHTCLGFSPSNPLFGENGKYSFCVETSATTEEGFRKCRENPDKVTFGARVTGDDYRSVLTYNPHFDEMMRQVVELFEKY